MAGPITTLSPTGRHAGPTQAGVLLAASCLPVLGAVLLAPVLPKLQDAFAGTPGVEALVPITLTIPALVIGILAPFAGRIVDAFGRRNLLTVTLLVYAVFGTAPLWLDSLPLIVLSRVGVGVAEAAIMTCCTTLLADYYSGPRRDRILGLQVMVTTLSATVFFGLGGALGDRGWRVPFWLYVASLPLAVLVALFIFPPAEAAGSTERRPLPPLPWRTLLRPCLISLFGGVVFYALIVELSYVLDGMGITSTATIGACAATASLATAAGAFTFSRLAPRGPAFLLPLTFGLSGLGLLVVAVGGVLPVVMIGAVITSFGTGLLLPTLLTWALSGLSYEQRGRGTGLWTASLFIGEFFCPLLILGVGALLTGLSSALAVLGVASLLATALLLRTRSRAAAAPASVS